MTDDLATAQAAVRQIFARYGTLPSYRAVLDVEGAPDPVGASIIGDEAAVERQLRRLAEIGVTDLLAAPFTIEADPAIRQRTYDFLAERAKSGR